MIQGGALSMRAQIKGSPKFVQGWTVRLLLERHFVRSATAASSRPRYLAALRISRVKKAVRVECA
jgi:hypothetical protein